MNNTTTANATVQASKSTGATLAETPAATFGIYQIIYVIIGMVGLVTNLFSLVVIVLHKPLRKRIPNLFLVNQSVLDVLVGGLLILTTGLSLLDPSTMTSLAAQFWCKLVFSRYLFSGPLAASTWNVAAMSVERYLEIVHPIRHKISLTRRKVYVTFAAVWIVGFGFKALNTAAITGFVGGVCVVGGLQSPALRKANVAANILVEFLIPTLIIVTCYISMYTATRKVAGSAATGPSVQMAKASRNIQKIFMFIVIGLVLSLVPKQVCVLLYAINTSLVDLNGVVFGLCVFVNYSNCCFNPFIYLFKYEEFKRGVRIVILRSNKATMISDVSSISAIAN